MQSYFYFIEFTLNFNHMLEVLTGFLGKAIGSLIGPVWKYFTAAFCRPNIKLVKAPKNLLEHLKPSASKDRARQLLGPPHQIAGEQWAYRFSDVLVQIEFWEDSGAKSIALGLVGNRKEHRFPVPICQKPLGQLLVADVQEGQDTLRYRDSLRHQEVLVEARLGPTGAWSHWTFGAMMAVGSRVLRESYFEWDHEAARLKTPQALVLINWIAVSNSDTEVYFDWSMG